MKTIITLTLAVAILLSFGIAEATTTTIDHTGILDGAIQGVPGAIADWTYILWNFRESYPNPSIYDGRNWMRIDLSSIPTGEVVTDVQLNLGYIDAYGGTNANNLYIGSTDEFTTSLDYYTYDGMNPWTDGPMAGVQPVDGGDTMPQVLPNLLGTLYCPGYLEIEYKQPVWDGTAMIDYIQQQVDAGKDAYLWAAIDDPAGGYQRFYSANYSSWQPYLEVTTAIPEPSVLILGFLALLARRRK
jgi:hypothetical protein